MSEVKSDNISNLHLSSEIIILSQSSQSGEIIITNNHHEKSICFKVTDMSCRLKLKFKKYLTSNRLRDWLNQEIKQLSALKPLKWLYYCQYLGRWRKK